MADPPAHASGPGADLRLSTALDSLPGVGPARARALKRLGLLSLSDLLRHIPLRYESHAAESGIDALTVGTIGVARGLLTAVRYVPAHRPGARPRFEAVIESGPNRLHLVWFNGGHLRRSLHAGIQLRVTGKVQRFEQYLQMVNPKWERLDAPPAIEPGPSGPNRLASPTQTAAPQPVPSGPDPAHPDASSSAHASPQSLIPAAAARLRPIYPATDSLASEVIERLIASVLERSLALIHDPLPPAHLTDRAMPDLATAYRWVHAPTHPDQSTAARRRLAYNEFLLLQLGLGLRQRFNHDRLIAPALRWSPAVDRHIRQRFPFDLTAAQEKVVAQILDDLRRPVPMNRLLQGDVGSGKTVVALYAMLLAVADRRQAALMAPTEVLVEQHARSIEAMLRGSNVRVSTLTAGRCPPRSAQRRRLLDDIQRGNIDIVLGTQALLTESVQFHDLAVVVIDEQHRFGVLQRARFRAKAASDDTDPPSTPPPPPEPVPSAPYRPTSPPNTPTPHAPPPVPAPHCLVMTATPIPRTLSLTVFGDLDISTIDALPPGRTPIVTRVVPPSKSDEVYRYVARRVHRGEQAYVVVPTIDAQGHESSAQLKSVAEHARELADRYFRGLSVGAMHGRLGPAERDAAMTAFRDGTIRVLVATTVIEVGVDVPTATVIVIEHAERFGLAQLHQLRGRVGRDGSGRKSLCVLIAQPANDDAQRRLRAIADTTDGFVIAERDLEIRGIGEFFGTRQHGAPPLRVARIPEDMDLLQLARRDARALLDADPLLSRPDHHLLRRLLLQHYGDDLELGDVG